MERPKKCLCLCCTFFLFFLVTSNETFSTLIVVHSSKVRTTMATFEEPEWKKVLGNWKNWVDFDELSGVVTRAYPQGVSGSDSKSDPQIVVYQKQKPRNFGLVVAVGGTIEKRALFNSKYFAEIQKSDKATWNLERVIPWNNSSYGSAMEERFANLNRGPFKFLKIEWFDGIEPTRIRSLDSNSPLYILDFYFENHHSASEAKVKRAEITVSSEMDWLPIRAAVQYDGAIRILTFSDWEQKEDCWVYKRYRSTAAPSLDREEGPFVEIDYSFDEISDEPDRKECFLSAYGILEPPIDSGINWTQIVLIAFSAVSLVAMLVWKFKEKHRA